MPKHHFHFVHTMNKVIQKNWFTDGMENKPVHVSGNEVRNLAQAH
jgi:hypothetical protein